MRGQFHNWRQTLYSFPLQVNETLLRQKNIDKAQASLHAVLCLLRLRREEKDGSLAIQGGAELKPLTLIGRFIEKKSAPQNQGSSGSPSRAALICLSQQIQE